MAQAHPLQFRVQHLCRPFRTRNNMRSRLLAQVSNCVAYTYLLTIYCAYSADCHGVGLAEITSRSKLMTAVAARSLAVLRYCYSVRCNVVTSWTVRWPRPKDGTAWLVCHVHSLHLYCQHVYVRKVIRTGNSIWSPCLH